MEKQKSFSVKPIRYLVFSFTVSFSLIFLIFFSTWIFKSHNLSFGSNFLTVHSLQEELNTTSSEFVLSNSILSGRNTKRDEDSSQIVANVTGSGGAQKRESEVTAVNELSGNASFNPSGKNVVLDKFNASYGTESTVNSSEGLGSVIATGDIVDSRKSGEQLQESNDNFKKEDRPSNVSFERQHDSIRNSIDQKYEVDCDITKGRWVFDESYPLYTNVTCPFVDEGFNCEGNGRLDKDYMKWRWKPQDCDLPRFNATKMLELIRGKRLVFVGDSINRNQWESMLCLLMGAVKDPKKVYEARGRKITKERNNYCFKFEDYKCTLEFYVSHFLVHESKARIGKKRAQTLRIDTIDKGSSRWRGADILVFNTAHWWNHHKTKAGINYYQERDQVYPQLDVMKAFQRALLTWASWVDKNINPQKTRIFFRSSAPSHFSGGLWNTGGHCKDAFRPLNKTFTSIYPERNLMVEETLRQMKNPVTFLNITRLSDYRPDAHPSMYGRKSVNPGVQDCSHWCLPGVPDNWNELLYYYLQSRTRQVL